MEREIYKELIKWKTSRTRKPLLVRGARQTGKTYILKEFGKNEYENCFYFNFEENPELEDFFSRSLNPKRILDLLSVYQKQQIRPGKDLIIFDEIQASNNALNSLKYFHEQTNEFHVASAGSLLGVKLSKPKSFPVGQVNILNLYPMTFSEFLCAIGESRYHTFISKTESLEPFPLPFHESLIDILKKYYLVGGMPEAVRHFAATGNFQEVRFVQNEILNTFTLNFSKHTPASDIPKLSMIWDSIPVHLARENKKFIFSAIRKSARARDYENALQWLRDAGLVYMAFAANRGELPLKGFVDRSIFKVYALDVGLLGAMANIDVDIFVQKDSLFNTYRGAFVESYVAQQLVSSLNFDLYYWKSEGRKAELDFLCEMKGNIFPLEVKAGINTKSKSLRSYNDQFNPKLLIRTTLLNLKQDGKICNIPLYAIEHLPKYVELGAPFRFPSNLKKAPDADNDTERTQCL